MNITLRPFFHLVIFVITLRWIVFMKETKQADQ